MKDKNFKFIGTLKDFKKVIERLIEHYPNNTTLYECLIKEYGVADVILC